MNPFMIIWFLVFVLPAWMIREGYDMLTKDMDNKEKKQLWDRFFIVLLIILCLIFGYLLLSGYS